MTVHKTPRTATGANPRSKRRERKTLMAALRGQNGAIDLASIMVGVLVIGIIGGVIAATVFAVVPWSQDQAAQADLGQVRQAEGVYAAAHAGGFADLATLQGPSSFAGGGGAPGQPGASISAAGTPLLPATDPARQLKINANANGFVAAETSQTGATFYVTSLNTTVSNTVPTVLPAGLSAPSFAVAAPVVSYQESNPTSLACVAGGNGTSVVLSWSPPASSGSSTNVTYQISEANGTVLMPFQSALSSPSILWKSSGASRIVTLQAKDDPNGTISTGVSITLYQAGSNKIACP